MVFFFCSSVFYAGTQRTLPKDLLTGFIHHSRQAIENEAGITSVVVWQKVHEANR